MMRNKMLVMLLVLGLVFVANTQESQAAIIDFGRTNISSPGVISYAGGSAPLVGTGIALQLVTNGPMEFSLTNAVLNFTTGAYLGNNQFASGGNIEVIGGVGEDIPTDTVLLSGTFTQPTSLVLLGGVAKGIFPTFADIKDDDLVALFGYDPSEFENGWSGWFNLTFNASGIPPAGFRSSKVFSGDIVNSAVPEPSSMMLLGMGILGLFGLGRRKA